MNGGLETSFGGVEEKRAVEAAEDGVVELEEVGLREFKGRGELQRELPDTVEEKKEGGSLEVREGGREGGGREGGREGGGKEGGREGGGKEEGGREGGMAEGRREEGREGGEKGGGKEGGREGGRREGEREGGREGGRGGVFYFDVSVSSNVIMVRCIREHAKLKFG